MRLLIASALVAAFLLGLGVAQAATIQNGDFEKGCDGLGNGPTPCPTNDIPDWVVVSNQTYTGVAGLDFLPNGGALGDLVHSGSFGVEMGDQPDAGGGSLLQTVATTPGATYTLLFWYRVFGCAACVDGAPNFGAFDVLVDGTPVFAAPSSEFVTGTGGWVPVARSFVAAGPTIDLMFVGANHYFDIGLDDVSLADGEVPEPGTIVLAGLSLLAFAALRNRAGR